MRYTVRKSFVDVLGPIWWPVGAMCSLRINLSSYDIENMRAEDGTIDRDSVEHWLMMNSGDFQAVTDFRASIEDGDTTIELDWSSEDNEVAYMDTLGECE
jgi:hypothetical protein